MMNFKDWLNVSEAAIDEKYAFKAVFMAGGPGSGKSFLRNKLFGHEFRVADSDKIQELFAKVRNATLEPRGRDFELSRNLNIKRTDYWTDAGFPLVIDITGRDLHLVYKLNTKLTQAGYDTGMVYVYSDLNTALARNSERQRKADVDFLKQAWMDAYENVPKFRELFRDRFAMIDNSDNRQLDIRYLNKIAHTVLGNPFQISNPIGRNKLLSQQPASNRFRPMIFPPANKRPVNNNAPTTTNSQGLAS